MNPSDRALKLPCMVPLALLASVFSLDGRPRYIHEGWFLISVANLTVICLMIAIFVIALFLPFPHDKLAQETAPPQEGEGA